MGSITKFKKKSSLFDKEQFNALAQEYSEISAQIKLLDERKKKLSALLKSGAVENGVRDDKGSSYLEVSDFIVGNVAKKSVKLNQDKAVALLKEKGLEDCIDVVTVETVNSDKLNSAVSTGKISLNEVESVTDISTSYSVSVKVKEEMPEVQQTTLKAAKRK